MIKNNNTVFYFKIYNKKISKYIKNKSEKNVKN